MQHTSCIPTHAELQPISMATAPAARDVSLANNSTCTIKMGTAPGPCSARRSRSRSGAHRRGSPPGRPARRPASHPRWQSGAGWGRCALCTAPLARSAHTPACTHTSLGLCLHASTSAAAVPSRCRREGRCKGWVYPSQASPEVPV